MLDLFGLDMLHYLSMPHMALSTMLKQTEVELGLISDIDMVEAVRKNIRGGVSFIGKRLVEFALNKSPEDGGSPVTMDGLLLSTFLNIDA